MAVARARIVSTGTNYEHHIDTAGFHLVADEPERAGGHGAGPAPYDYYLASLAACTAITLRMYAQRKGWELGRLTVDLVLRKDADGHASVHRTLHSDAALDATQTARLLEIVANTPVTKTMREGAAIETAWG